MLSREMPKYQCHKQVWALKIDDIIKDVNCWVIFPKEDGFAPINVSSEYVAKHNPQPGGYYVVYAGGYQSYSPADAFESGYTKI